MIVRWPDLAFPSRSPRCFRKKLHRRLAFLCLANSSQASIDVFAAPGNGSGRFVLFHMSLIGLSLLPDIVALLMPSLLPSLGSDEYAISMDSLSTDFGEHMTDHFLASLLLPSGATDRQQPEMGLREVQIQTLSLVLPTPMLICSNSTLCLLLSSQFKATSCS